MLLGHFYYLMALCFGLWRAYVVSGDTCTSETEGLLGCISFSYYYGDQWAVCASEREVRANSEHRCYVSYCWLPCVKVTRGRSHGFISQECRCNSSNNLVRRDLDFSCYTRTNGECSWYSDCLAKSTQCSGDTSANQLAQRMCNVFERHQDTLSVDGKSLIRDLQQCLQRSLYSLILPGGTQNCFFREQRTQNATTYCLKKTSISSKFRQLVPNDQSNIFWTVKSLLVDAFGPKSTDMLDTLRNCYKGNVRSAEKRFIITTDASEAATGQSFVDNFAQELGWPSKNIVWDGHRMPQISKSIASFNVLFKHKSEFDFTENSRLASAIDIYSDMRAIEVKLQRKSGDGTIVIDPENHTAFVKGIGKCPYRVGNGGIFDSFHPEYKEIRNVGFELYRRHGVRTYRGKLNYFDNESIKRSPYNGNLKTYFITHGFTNNGNETWIQQMVSTLLQQDDCNVIVVDWEGAADISIKGIYIQAAVNTRLIGCLLGKMVEKLKNLKSTDYKDVHLVGHSLGAHVSGFAGAYIGGNIARITGLDPAGPLFRKKSAHFRLDEDDAVFVDVIHTDALWFLFGYIGYGIGRPIGNIDFYPNGGARQPGCKVNIAGCSHSRAHELFTASITPEFNCLACRCSRDDYKKGDCHKGRTCTLMGLNVNTTLEGSFFLDTNKASPFCV